MNSADEFPAHGPPTKITRSVAAAPILTTDAAVSSTIRNRERLCAPSDGGGSGA